MTLICERGLAKRWRGCRSRNSSAWCSRIICRRLLRFIETIWIISVLTTKDTIKQWLRNKLKLRLKEEGNETVTNCHALKMRAEDGTILEKVLGRANIERFPDDFMFELTKDEYDSLRCKNFTLKSGRGQHSKYPFGANISTGWWQIVPTLPFRQQAVKFRCKDN